MPPNCVPPISDYVYTAYVQPPQSNDQILPPLGNVKAAADAIDNAIYTASNYYSYPSWPTPFTAWVYPWMGASAAVITAAAANEIIIGLVP